MLGALPESPSTSAQAFDIRLELRTAAGPARRVPAGDGPPARGRGARRGLERRPPPRAAVCAFMTNAHSQLGELDEAVKPGPARWPSAEPRRGPGPSTARPRPISSRRTTSAASTSEWSSSPPRTSRRCPPAGVRAFGAAMPSRSTIATSCPEPRRARPVRRGRAVRGRGAPARRAHAARRTPSGWPIWPRAGSTPQGGLGQGRALIERGVAVVPEREHRARPAPRGGLVGVGPRAGRRDRARRWSRSGGRAALERDGGERNRRDPRG